MIKAIILAAGRGSRLKGFFNKPKCLIKLGKYNLTLLERTYKILKDSSIDKINIITGYKHRDVYKILKKKVSYIYFKNYRNTNNLQTLLFAKKLLNSSFICLFADIIYEKKIINKLLKNNKEICLAVDTSKVLEGTMRVKIKKNKIIDIGSHIPVTEGNGNFIGIAKFSHTGAQMLRKYLLKEKNNFKDYYTQALRKMIANNIDIDYIKINQEFWKEIDTNKDLIDAKLMIHKLDI
tara:strand:- start:4378 stop:5085 length:708 start_codon:yes stop_codon:yes gene_type:complete